MAFDLSHPMQLIAALVPDIIIMVGAMILMLVAAWGSESSERQRSVGVASIGVCVVSMLSIIYFMATHASAGGGVIAVDNFRWIVDLVVLAAAAGTIALMLDYNARENCIPRHRTDVDCALHSHRHEPPQREVR